MASKTFADGSQDVYTYNAKQQLTNMTEPGVNITNGYNSAGDQTSTTATDTASGATVADTSTFNAAGEVATVTQVSSDGSSATNAFTYDANGNIATETEAGGITTAYTYFGAGAPVPGAEQSVTLQRGGVVLSQTQYVYNGSQQLSEIISNGLTTTYTYQPGTNVIATVTSGGVTTTYGYDPDTGSLTSIAAGSAYSASYTYNANQQRATQTVSQTNPDGSTTSLNLTYGYDGQNQLASVSGSQSESYTYDGAGNRTGTSMGTANLLNQYSNFTYNSRGDLTDDGTYTYTWNALDQLTSVTAHDNSVRVTYQYNGQGLRIAKNVYAWNP